MNEKITIAIVDLSGSPKSGATVELRFGASVYAGAELGTSGNYHWSSIPLGKYFLWVNGADTGESFAVGEGELARLGYDDGKVLKSTTSSIIWSDGFVEKTGSVMSGALYNTDKIIAGWNGNTSAYTDYTLLDGNGFAHYKFSDLIGTSEANGQYRADSINLFSSLGTATSFNVRVDTDSYSTASTDLANAVGHASTFLNNQATYDLFKQAAYSIWSDDAGGYAWFGSPYADSSPFSAKQFMFATDGTNSVEFFTNDLRFNGQSIFVNPDKSTGLLTWTGTKLTKVDTTHVSITAGTGQIVDTQGNVTKVSWAGNTNLLDAFVNSTSNTFYLINSSGAIIQQGTFPTPTECRQNIYLGFSAHAPVGTITVVTADPTLAFNEMCQVRDMFGSLGYINRGVKATSNGANLQINTIAGYLYRLGIGFSTSATDPSRIFISAQTPATFQYRTQTGVATGNLTSLEVGYYDVAGTRTAIGSNKYSNQRIYISPSGQVRIAYGQAIYNSLASAVAAINTEPYVPYTPFTTNFSLIGIVSVGSNATDLSNPTQALFSNVSIFGESIGIGSGVGVTTLQQAYDNGSEPEIVTNATRGALSIKRGSNADTDTVFEILNGAGAVVASITGEGSLSAVIAQSQVTNLTTDLSNKLDNSATEQEKAGILGVTGALRIKQSSDLSQLLFGHTLENKSDWKFLLESNQTSTNNWIGLRVRQDAGATDYPIKIQRVTGGAIEFYRPVEAYNNDFLVTHDSTKKSILQVTSADTTVQRSAQIIKHKTSALAGSGLGVILEALGEDSGASEFKIGAIDFVRTTANGTGDVYLQSSLGGVYQNVLRLRSDKISEFYGTLILNSAGYSASQYLKTDASKQVVSQDGIPWGDLTSVPSTFTPSAHVHAWADITSGKPTTLAGYGITDGVSLSANNAFTGINTFTSATTAPIQSVRSGAVSTTPLVLQTFTLATTATGVSDYFGPELLFYGSLNGTYKSYAKIGGHRYNSDNTGGLSIYTSDGSTWQRGITQTHLGKILLPVSTVTRAGLSIGAFGVGPSSPEDGDIFKSAADTLQIRMSTNTRTIPFLQTAQTWSAVQTFSSTPVISSTSTSIAAGAVYRVANRGMADYELLARLSAYTVFKASGGTTVSNTTTETSISTAATFGIATLPANFMQLSTLIRVTVPFAYTNTNGRLLTLKLKLGGTTIASCQFTQATTTTRYESITFQAYATLAPAASVPVIGAISHMSPTLPIVVENSTGTSTSLATNGSLAVTVTAQWNTAESTSTFAGYISTIEVV